MRKNILRQISGGLVALGLIGLAGCATSTSVSKDRLPAATELPFTPSQECAKFIMSLPADYRYGWVLSTENDSRKDLSNVYTFFYYRPGATGAIPTVIFNGGPGYDSHTTYDQLKSVVGLDPIFIDQRGTGCSSAYPASRPMTDYYAWGTKGIAQDAEQVRKALGIPAWNVFGQSFGALIAHRYLEMYPENVLTIVAHGGAPQDLKDDLQQRFEQQLFVIQKYFETFPEDRQLVIDIVNKKFCSPNGAPCGSNLLQQLAVQSLGYQFYWKGLHGALALVHEGALQQQRQPSQADAETDSVTLIEAKDAISLADMGQVPIANCLKVVRKARQILKDMELFSFSECWRFQSQVGVKDSALKKTEKYLKSLNVERINTQTIRQNLTKFPKIQFYLFSSELDYFSPPGTIRSAANKMGSRVIYKEIKNAGHEAFLTTPEILEPLLNNRKPASVKIPMNSPPPPPIPISSPIPISDQCTWFIRSLPPGYEYGWVSTKEDVRRDDLPPVYTFYYHRPQPGQTPAAFFNGGPLADSHTSFTVLDMPDIWIVYLDQRGTGCSSPLPVNRPYYDYAHWGTSGIVRDAEAIREKLGLSQWNIFGQSYGSHVVHRYIEQFPEKIKTAIGHGGTTIGLKEAGELRMRLQLKVVKKYLETYPEDKELVRKIVTGRLCKDKDEDSICGSSLVRELSLQLMGFNDYWKYLHEAFKRVVELGISKPWPSQLRQKTLTTADEMSPAQIASGYANYMIGLVDTTDFEAINCLKVSKMAQQMLGDPALFALSECWYSNGLIGWSKQKAYGLELTLAASGLPRVNLMKIRANLEEYPSLKFLLYSSEWDFYTPASMMKIAAQRIGPRVIYKDLKGVGHEAFQSNEVIRELIKAVKNPQ